MTTTTVQEDTMTTTHNCANHLTQAPVCQPAPDLTADCAACNAQPGEDCNPDCTAVAALRNYFEDAANAARAAMITQV